VDAFRTELPLLRVTVRVKCICPGSFYHRYLSIILQHKTIIEPRDKQFSIQLSHRAPIRDQCGNNNAAIKVQSIDSHLYRTLIDASRIINNKVPEILGKQLNNISRVHYMSTVMRNHWLNIKSADKQPTVCLADVRAACGTVLQVKVSFNSKTSVLTASVLAANT
jgi:hypothetical protein